MITPEQLQVLLPKALSWIEADEAEICRQGVPLEPEEIAIAKEAGIQEPQYIRLRRVDTILPPTDPVLRQAVLDLEIITPDTVGLTMRYGIFVRADGWRQSWLVAHELMHTAQYLSLGIEGFLQSYAQQCQAFGYKNAPLELEALAFGEKYKNLTRR